MQPTTRLQLRKVLFPFAVTRLSLGVDVDARTGRVAFRWSWKDRLVGGRLSWSGGEVALTKRFPLGGGGGALSVRGSVDVATGRRALAVAIVPLEGVTSHGAPPGFAFRRHIPLEGRTALRLAGRVQFPSTVTLGGGGAGGGGPSVSGNAFKLFLDEVALRVCLP